MPPSLVALCRGGGETAGWPCLSKMAREIGVVEEGSFQVKDCLPSGIAVSHRMHFRPF
ncbi:MAG: hypothetical protein WHT46_06025 [Candidatus Geothermincolales bacterium]